MISKTAVIHIEAEVSPDCRIGDYCVIEEGAVLESGVELGHHVVVHAQTRVGAGTIAGDGCVLWACSPSCCNQHCYPERTGPPCDRQELHHRYRCCLSTGVQRSRIPVFWGITHLSGKSANWEETVLVGQRVVVENSVEIGDNTKIQTGAYITASTKIGESVFIAPMVTTTNDNYMGADRKRFADRCGASFEKGCRVGGGATILPGVTIGEEAFIAAGS